MDGIRLTGWVGTALAAAVPAVTARWRGLLTFAIFTTLACYSTWPFPIDPQSMLTAPWGGDVSSSVAHWTTLVREGDVPYFPGKLESIGWPEGIRRAPGLELDSFVSSSFLWIGSLTIGPVAAHGLEAIIGYVLTGTVTTAFIRRVTGSLGGGLVAGVGVAFFPFFRSMASAAPTYMQVWMFILMIWAFWLLAQHATRRAALLAGLTYVPAMWLTPYYALHGFVVSVACLAAFVAVRSQPGAEFRSRLRLVPFVVVPWIVSTVVYVAIGVVTKFNGVPSRSLQDAYDLSAHPLEYVLPGPRMKWWPSGANEFLVEQVPRASGVNLYLGLSVIALGIVGVVTAIAAWRRTRPAVTPPVFAALLGSAVVFATFICSLPPHVAGNRIPMPSLIVVNLVPQLRTGQRYVMPVAAGVAILAGLGAAALLRRFPGLLAIPATVLLAAVVYADNDAFFGPFYRMPQFESPALAVLARQPVGPAIHYSSEDLYPGEAQRTCFIQGQFRMPLVTDCYTQQVPLNPQVFHLATLDHCAGMKDMRDNFGLRYVIVEYSEPRALACFEKRQIAPFRVVSSDRYLRVFDLRPGAPAVSVR